MANGSLPHFVGPEVLDSVFQQLVARRIPLGKAMREIMEVLQGGDLCLSMYVAGGVRAVQPMHFATKEEEEQAREEYRAAVAKYDYDAAEDAICGTSPPGGIIGPLGPGDWGHKVTLVIRDRHLLIKWLDPTFPPEFYKFAIVNPEAVDMLLVAVGTVQEPGAAVNRNPTVSEPPRRPPRAEPKRHKTAQDVWNEMESNPAERDKRGYATGVWNKHFKSKGVSLKTIQNLVSAARKEFKQARVSHNPKRTPKKSSRGK